jgi:hypothetical protein
VYSVDEVLKVVLNEIDKLCIKNPAKGRMLVGHLVSELQDKYPITNDKTPVLCDFISLCDKYKHSISNYKEHLEETQQYCDCQLQWIKFMSDEVIKLKKELQK